MNLFINDKINWSTLLAKFAFHLADTHGYPKEVFLEDIKMMRNEEIEAWFLKHKDFVRRVNEFDYTSN